MLILLTDSQFVAIVIHKLIIVVVVAFPQRTDVALDAHHHGEFDGQSTNHNCIHVEQVILQLVPFILCTGLVDYGIDDFISCGEDDDRDCELDEEEDADDVEEAAESS